MATSPDDVAVPPRFSLNANTMTEPPTRQLDFYQAMSDFRQMFPDLEEDVIEAVLRSNNGAVDATIDQLLTMNVDAGSSTGSLLSSSTKGPSADSFSEPTETYPYHITDSSSDEDEGKNGPPIYSSQSNEYANLSDMSSPRSGRTDHSISSSSRSDCLASSANTTDLLMALGSPSPGAGQAFGQSSMSASATSALTESLMSDTPIKQPMSCLLDEDVPSSSMPPKMSLLEHDYTVRQKGAAVASEAIPTPSPPPLGAVAPVVNISPLSTPGSLAGSLGATVALGGVGSLGGAGSVALGGVGSGSLGAGSLAGPGALGGAGAGSLGGAATLGAATLGATPPEKTVFCDRHRTYTGKRVYHNWNPPMLGSLPDDFLRISLTPPSSTSSSPRHQPQVAKVTPSHTPTHNPRPLSSPARSLSSPSWSPSRSRSSTPRSDCKAEKIRHTPSRTLSLSAHGSEELTLLKQRLVKNEEAMARARSKSVDQETQRMLADEHLALALQNEEFLKVLKDDKDFMDQLERDRMNATAFEPSFEQPAFEPTPVPAPMPQEPVSKPKNQLNAAFDPDLQSPDLDPNRPPKEQIEGYGDDQFGELGTYPFSADLHPDDDAEFRRQLKHMGGSSKKRLMTLAKKFFSRTKKKSKPKHSYKEVIAPSTTNLLDEDDDDLHHYHRHSHNSDDMHPRHSTEFGFPRDQLNQYGTRMQNGI